MSFLGNLVTQLLRPERTKTSATGPMVAWHRIGQPVWTPRRYDALAEEGFRKNVIAYRCVMQIANACAAVPWLLYDAPTRAEIDHHPLLDLLRHPNPLQDGVTFLESVYANLEITGNAYIEAVTPHEGGAPMELYALRPDRMRVIPGPSGLPQGYQYSVNGQTTVWDADPINGASNILHLKRFHPLDDWYGLAPMEAAMMSIDQHNAAGAWNQALLNQGARPSGALVYAPKDGPATLSDDQLRRLREEMGLMYQGDRNAGRPMILEGGLDWKEMSLSPKDMDWLAGRNNAARDIALAFGVPPQLVGIADSQTHANFAEARMAFYEETVLPLLTRVTSAFDHWLSPQFGNHLQLDYDVDAISALADRREAQWDKICNATFLTRNEQRQAAGYDPLPEDDGHDESEDPDGAEIIPFSKFNPNHDELGRFTFGPGGNAQNSHPQQAKQLKTSKNGKTFIAKHEGFKPKPYLDSAGRLTIGFGHLIKPNEDFTNGITREHAERLLAQDISFAESSVQRQVTAPITQNQFDALTSLIYNIGSRNFEHSTLLQNLNQGNYSGAADQFLVWNKITNSEGQHHVDSGLANRRHAERELFLNSTY